MAGRRFFVGGNWKMNYSKAVLEKINEALGKTKDVDGEKKLFEGILFRKCFIFQLILYAHHHLFL
jgi:triosephosphate isomerase